MFNQKIRSILIIRLSSLGDIVQTTGFIASCRAVLPEAEIVYFTLANFAPVLDNNPHIDRIIATDRAVYRRGFLPAWRETGRLYRALRDLQADLVFDLHGIGETRLAAALTGSRRRYAIGSNRPKTNSERYRRLNHFQFQGLHIVEQHLDLLYQAGFDPPLIQPELFLAADVVQGIENWLRSQSVAADESLIYLTPSTSWPSKCYPLSRYKEIITRLAAQGHRVIIGGDRRERPSLDEFHRDLQVNGPRPLLSAGLFDLPQTAALLARCRLVLGGDTGPLFMADALDVPTLMLMGPTAHSPIRPYRRGTILQADKSCQPCYKRRCPIEGTNKNHCLADLTVDKVMECLGGLLR